MNALSSYRTIELSDNYRVNAGDDEYGRCMMDYVLKRLNLDTIWAPVNDADIISVGQSKIKSKPLYSGYVIDWKAARNTKVFFQMLRSWPFVDL